MLSETDIANFALSQLGSYSAISNLETDTSKEARVMRTIYWSILRTLLSAYNWNWATVFARLPIYQLWPTPEWAFAYIVPNDCVTMGRIWNSSHHDDVETVIEYVKSNNGKQNLILSNYGPSQILPSDPYTPVLFSSITPAPTDAKPIPILQYVQYTDNVSLMPEPFKMGFALILSAMAAPSLPGIGQVDLREKNLKLGNVALAQASASDQNEIKLPGELRSFIERAGTGGPVRANTASSRYIAQNYQD